MVGLAVALYAQAPAAREGAPIPPEKRVEAWTAYLTAELQLRPDQQEKLKEILTAHQKQIRQLTGGRPPREKAQALRKQTDTQIEALLDEAQKAKWRDLKADWRRRARTWHRQHKGQDIGED
ncbi:MAG: hypothetical protein D6750_08885 [Bacteroidetes bacterium]|nr:MAG: hypothetical protein D6750_08885 [Bacteroidota bacterium]